MRVFNGQDDILIVHEIHPTLIESANGVVTVSAVVVD